MRIELYLKGVKIGECVDNINEHIKARLDYALIHNVEEKEIESKHIPENIEDEDYLNGHYYPAHEMYD